MEELDAELATSSFSLAVLPLFITKICTMSSSDNKRARSLRRLFLRCAALSSLASFWRYFRASAVFFQFNNFVCPCRGRRVQLRQIHRGFFGLGIAWARGFRVRSALPFATARDGGLHDGHGSADPRAVEEDALPSGPWLNNAERLRVLRAIGLLSSACSNMLPLLHDASIDLGKMSA